MTPRSAPHPDFTPRLAADHVTIGGHAHAVRQRVVLATPFFTLLHFEHAALPAASRILVVEPLSGIRASMLFDMLTDLQANCDVYTLIWTDPANVEVTAGIFGLDDNIDAVIYALQYLGPGTHLIGLCQSAMPALAATAILCAGEPVSRPASLTLLGGKLDTRINPTRLDALTRDFTLGWFVRNTITLVPPFRRGAGRAVYSAGLQSVLLLTYITRHTLTGGEIFRKIVHDDGDDTVSHPFFGLLFSPVAIPAEFFLDTVFTAFHDSTLAEGRLHWRGLKVNPGAITDVPLLTIEAGEDDIAAPGQTYVAHRLCTALPPALRAHHLEPGIGHFGLFHGAVWRGSILPRLLGFLRGHARS